MLAFVMSVGSFIPGLFGKTLSQRAAKAAGIAILVLLAIAAFLICKHAYDASIVNDAEVRHEAVAAQKERDADREADRLTQNKADAFDESQAALAEALNRAERDQPVATASTVGPATSAYYAELRRQKEKK